MLVCGCLTDPVSSHLPNLGPFLLTHQQIPTGSNICHHLNYQNCRKLTLKIQISEKKGIKMLCSPAVPKISIIISPLCMAEISNPLHHRHISF